MCKTNILVVVVVVQHKPVWTRLEITEILFARQLVKPACYNVIKEFALFDCDR